MPIDVVSRTDISEIPSYNELFLIFSYFKYLNYVFKYSFDYYRSIMPLFVLKLP
jgi:hypothetical protein